MLYCIISCFFLFFWFIDLYFFISVVITQIAVNFISIALLVIPIEIQTKEAKAKQENKSSNCRNYSKQKINTMQNFTNSFTFLTH